MVIKQKCSIKAKAMSILFRMMILRLMRKGLIIKAAIIKDISEINLFFLEALIANLSSVNQN